MSLIVSRFSPDRSRREQAAGDAIEKRAVGAEEQAGKLREGYCTCFLHDEHFADKPKRYDYRLGKEPPVVCQLCRQKAWELHNAGAKFPIGNRKLPTALAAGQEHAVDKTLWVPDASRCPSKA